MNDRDAIREIVEREVIGIPEAAHILSVTEERVRQLVGTGALPKLAVSRKRAILMLRADVDNLRHERLRGEWKKGRGGARA